MCGCRQLYAGDVGVIEQWECNVGKSGAGAIESTARHEIALLQRGYYRKHVGNRVISADPNHAVFFNRDEEFRVSHPVDGGDVGTMLAVDLAMVREAAGEVLRPPARDAHRFSVPHVWIDHRTFAVYGLLVHAVQSSSTADRVEIDELMWWLLDRILTATANGGVRDSHSSRRPWTHARAVDTVKAFLAEHYSRRVTLRQIAASTTYSPFHLSRIFRRGTGVPIHQYLIQLRLRATLGRLLESADTLSQIGLDAGFSSHSHFTAAFRRAFGILPSAVRDADTLNRIRTIANTFQAVSP